MPSLASRHIRSRKSFRGCYRIEDERSVPANPALTARGERLHGRIHARGSWAVGWTSSDDALAICGSPSATLSIHPGRGGSHLLSGRQHMDFGRHYGRNRSRAGLDRGGPWFRHRQVRCTAPPRLPSSLWRTITIRGLGRSGTRERPYCAALGYACDHMSEALTLEHLAEAAGMSRRQFSRAFRAQTGATPARMVERLRAHLARGHIETTAEPVERVAEAVDFGDAENMRRARVWENGAPLRTKLRTLMRLKSQHDFERSPSAASRSSFPAPKEPRR